MTPKPPTLQAALDTISVSGELPPRLPAAHLTVARHFSAVVEGLQLLPRECSVFNREVLYLHYGALHYRPHSGQTEQSAELPIGFLLRPTVYSLVWKYFPFDTGALALGKFGRWTSKLTPFKARFAARGMSDESPRKLVQIAYQDNKNYLRGNPSAECCKAPAPFPQLHEFLIDDLSGADVDHRQRSIECIVRDPIKLSNFLLWVGFPEAYDGAFRTLCEKLKDVPEYWRYPYTRNSDPSQIAAKLEARAAEVAARYDGAA